MGTKGFTKAANRMKARAAEIRGTKGKLYQNLSEDMSRSISKNVDAEGREPKWKKRKDDPYWPPWPILYKTGRMRTRGEVSALGPWQVMGTRHILAIKGPEYGLYHQYDTPKRPSLPVRKYVKLTTKENEKNLKRFRAVLSRKRV